MLPVLSLLSAGGAAAQSVEYFLAPIQGGNVTDLAYDRHREGVVYAAVSGPGLFKSLDGGETFVAVPLPGIRPHMPVELLASRAEAGVVLVCASSVYRSEDFGETFAETVSPLSTGCTALAEGNEPGTYYAASGRTPDELVLHTSTDSGVTWTATPMVNDEDTASRGGVSSLVQLPSGRLVFGLAESPPDFYLAGFGGLAFSDDGIHLTSVTDITRSVIDLAWNGVDTLRAFTFDPSYPELWESADGETFTEVSFASGSDAFAVHAELRYVSERDVFLSLSSERLLQSSSADDGYRFDGERPINGYIASSRALGHLQTAAADPNDPDVWLLGTAAQVEGVFHRKGDTKSWKVATGIHVPELNHALYDPETGYQYAANECGRVFFADAGALSFRSVFRGKGRDNETVSAVAYDRSDPKRIVLALYSEQDSIRAPLLLELADATTAPIDTYPGPHTAWTEAADPKPRVDGEHIRALLVQGQTRYVAYSAAESTEVGQFLYRSVDGGASYQALPLRTQHGVWMLAADPTDNSVVYAAGGDDTTPADPETKGLFRSTDGGDRWEQVSLDAGLDALLIERIAFDPDDSARFWIASLGMGSEIWQTLDGGLSFTDITPGPPSPRVSDITYSPELGRIVVAQTTGAFARGPGPDGKWEPLAELYGEPLDFYEGAQGVATTAGLYVVDALLGSATNGAAGSPSTTDGGSSATDDGGCGCRSVPGGGTDALGVLWVLGLLWLRRLRGQLKLQF